MALTKGSRFFTARLKVEDGYPMDHLRVELGEVEPGDVLPQNVELRLGEELPQEDYDQRWFSRKYELSYGRGWLSCSAAGPAPWSRSGSTCMSQ